MEVSDAIWPGGDAEARVVMVKMLLVELPLGATDNIQILIDFLIRNIM